MCRALLSYAQTLVCLPLSQICESLGADGLIYQNVEDLKAVANELNPNITQFDASCFTGEYITGKLWDNFRQP